MSFDRTKAMRNAERYVAHGKIRAAILEYRSVVDNDPRDIATLNMLGDLYAKSADTREAVECYLQVANHYNTQGFAQKAIAIYNKISRIEPDSIEVATKLAELHKVKGSLSEARSHYVMLAEHYQKNGRMIEALAMYKQIALLDPNNTDVCISLADAYLRENQRGEAVGAFAEAGNRFSRQNKHEEAVQAFMKGFDVKSTDMRILGGLVKAHTALGRAAKAVSLLEEILENEPYNRDVLYLLIECCVDSQDTEGAEKAVIKLVEIEPANYTKFLDLIRIYISLNDHESAARILTMSAEYMLAAGQADECSKWIHEILERDPSHMSTLRLLVRYNSFLNDKAGLRLALERLYATASLIGSIEDERYALAQLVVIRPHETRYQDRLDEISTEYGFEETEVDQALLIERFADNGDAPSGEFKVDDDMIDAVSTNGNGNGHLHEVVAHDIIYSDDDHEKVLEAEIVEADPAPNAGTDIPLSHADERKIQTELESIQFYIDNEYHDLAIKALSVLANEYGEREEFAALREQIGGGGKPDNQVKPPAPARPVADEYVANTLGINEIRSEFGIGIDDVENEDYETHYQLAVAYQEMGLFEEAIREFQDAIIICQPDDGTRRFFHCANLLGHCFLQNGMANHAITWFGRALKTPNITDEEHHGLWYELGLAHEANGDHESAARYFEQIYAENVDFRDVSSRVHNLVGDH
jgi:tetratricopeptide (TPR) repeat protein